MITQQQQQQQRDCQTKFGQFRGRSAGCKPSKAWKLWAAAHRKHLQVFRISSVRKSSKVWQIALT
jgi:hypothetical protein